MIMEHIQQLMIFLRLFVLFLAIACVTQNIFKLIKSALKMEEFKLKNSQIIVLWFSVSYILTIIFI